MEPTPETWGNVPSYPFDEDRILRDRRLFSDEIDDDPWTLFHGTFGEFESSIDHEGIAPNDGTAHANYIYEISIAHRRFTKGRRTARRSDCIPGYGLAAFAYQDFDRGKPVYLTASSLEAVSYASPERRGGEIASSLRGALHELAEVAQGDQSDLNTIECITWMKENRSWFIPLVENVMAANASDVVSIVYAARMQLSSINGLKLGGRTEVFSSRPIQPSELIAKMIIPQEFFARNPGLDLVSFDFPRLKRKRVGVLGAILKAERAQSS